MPDIAEEFLKTLKVGGFFPQLDALRKSGESIIQCVERFLCDMNVDSPTAAIMMVVGYAHHCNGPITEQSIIDGLEKSPLFKHQRTKISKKLNELVTHKKITISADGLLS
jgi:hypothetical protein